jgi:2-oxoglutarate ferredoxin oxidoreductase subunit beta
MARTEIPTLTRQDFVSDQEVRWCPGCGDYAILAQMQKIMPEIGVPKENIVFISGIGCSSRFPYYMNTYGIHSIHGRAPTLATGLKAANPDLSVWVITGDGDSLSIGGNHLLHACRRNTDLQIILFNNQIYGLTKGQYSPTSPAGTVTKSSPLGSIEQPLNPISVALSAEATFIARSVDIHGAHLQDTLSAAAAHNGTAFVEIFQNCLIFNDGAFEYVTDRTVRDDQILPLEHGKPMIYGKELNRGIRLNGMDLEIVAWEAGESPPDDLQVHDETSPALAFILSRMAYPDFPTPMGVLRRVHAPTYNYGLMSQIAAAQEKRGPGDLRSLFFTAETWTIDPSDGPDHSSEIEGGEIVGLDEQYIEELGQRTEEESAIEHSLATDLLTELRPHKPITILGSAPLADTVGAMRARNVGSMLVVDEAGVLIGVFTERDILNRVVCRVENLADEKLSDFMTRNPVTLSENAPIAHALSLMSNHGFRHLPIVDEAGIPVGVISFRDVVDFIERYFSA